MGQNVQILHDGQVIDQTFAGKLTFKDGAHRWQSVCAAVHSPVRQGQVFTVIALKSSKAGGNIAKAGNIVAMFFKSAQTPDQCAGLQIAVWKAIEDGTDQADFTTGNFQVQASPRVMAWAAQYYTAIATAGEAAYIQTAQGQNGQGNQTGQSQLSTLT
jgi:hypothetical protein